MNVTLVLQINKNVTRSKPSNHNRNMNTKSNQSLADIFVCTCFYRTHLGSYPEPAGHLVHYSLLIWSHLGAKGVSLHGKQFFSMEPSKANTVGIIKNSPSLRTTRKILKFSRACSGLFFPQNGKDNKPNHALLLELPCLRIKPKTQSQQGKK